MSRAFRFLFGLLLVYAGGSALLENEGGLLMWLLLGLGIKLMAGSRQRREAQADAAATPARPERAARPARRQRQAQLPGHAALAVRNAGHNPEAMRLLAVSVQFYGQPRIVGRLKPAAFWPRPDVDSAVVRIDLQGRPKLAVPDEACFFRVARAGFSQRRKQLRNALGNGLGISSAAAAGLLAAADIDPQRRAQTLALEEWAALSRVHAGACQRP